MRCRTEAPYKRKSSAAGRVPSPRRRTLFSFCRAELRESADPRDLLIEIGIPKPQRRHLFEFLSGGDAALEATPSACARVRATLDGVPTWTGQARVDGEEAQIPPTAFSALTLVGTRSVAPGRIDAGLPDHNAATMKRPFSRSTPERLDAPGR